MSLSILYVGTHSGTCLQRAQALESLGHEVRFVESGPPPDFLRWQIYRLGHHLNRPPDLLSGNRRMLRAAAETAWDVVWVDKGRSIRPRALASLRQMAPGAKLVSYSPDNMMAVSNSSAQYRACVPIYDLHVTTKPYNVEELRELGAQDVLYVDNAYDPSVHRRVELSDAEGARYACDVGFVGYFEEERAHDMLELARAGVPVVVRGPAWARFGAAHPELRVHDQFLEDGEYAKAINATRISLGFLRKCVRDLQTTRSIEIPACGGFLLAERTDDHTRLFEEGREAEFFGSFEELLDKCRYYLCHEDERRRIAEAGQRRCVDGGYSNQGRLRSVLAHLGLEPGDSRSPNDDRPS